MIRKIAHFADIHIKDIKTIDEYRQVFQNAYSELDKNPVDRIVVTGDLFHTKNNIKNEAKILAKEFLTKLSEYALVIITNGNHDGNPNNKEQLNSLQTLITLIDNPKIKYLNRSGVFVDDNVEWRVWDYFDGKNPYEISDTNDNLIGIDLYHNPVTDCEFYSGQKSTHSFSIDNFKGKYFLLGDIHKRQFFQNKKIHGAYVGSLIQQDYGEDLENHGFLIWDIIDNKVEEINISNRYCYQTLRITSNEHIELLNESSINTNYDFINLRIIWEDIESNINVDNEKIIRKKVYSLWGDKLVKLKIVKKSLSSSFEDILSKSNEEIENSDLLQLENIITSYLTENKYDKDKIEKVLNLDKINSENLVWEFNSVQWSLLEIELDNYRSHGDSFKLDLRNKDGIYQIKGLNEQGKTNLLSSIMYLLYGKTLETQKREKNGDLRFINNKTNKDYCKVSGKLLINGEEFYLERISELKWNRTKSEVSSVSTKFNWSSSSINENEENRIKSQKVLDQAIGTFEDFLRSSFITADSLNGLLSLDESTFLDSLLKESGLEIFEKKLEEFKKYEKLNPLFNPKIDVVQSELEIDMNKREEQILLEDIKIKNAEIIIKEKELDKNNKEKESLLKQIKEIPKLKDSNNILFEISNLDDEISNYRNILKTHIDNYNKILDLTPEELQDNEFYIEAIEQFELFKNSITEKINSIKKTKIDIELKKAIEENNLSNFKNDKLRKESSIININKNIENKTNSINKSILNLIESENCITCKRPLEESQRKEIEVEIKKLEIELLDFIKLNEKEIKLIEKEIKVIDSNVKQTEVLLKNEYDLSKYDIQIKDTEKEFIENYESHKKILTLKQNFDVKKEKLKERETINLKISNVNSKIEILEKSKLDLNNEILEIKKWEKEIINQQNINNKLILCNSNINDINNQIKNINEIVWNISKINIPKLKETNIKIQEDIVKQNNFDSENEIREIYQAMIHRNGLPKYLLSKYRNNINITLSNLLSSLSFNCGFDENMFLKMWDNIKPESQLHVLNGSGKQRTFIALALRIALRNINKTCLNDILFMDEIMGKLVDNSVDEFIELLLEIKNKINKIFIVEHSYSESINPDYILSVTKNEKGVSSINYSNI